MLGSPRGLNPPFKAGSIARRHEYEANRDINEFFYSCCKTTVPHVCLSRRRVCGFNLANLYEFALGDLAWKL